MSATTEGHASSILFHRSNLLSFESQLDYKLWDEAIRSHFGPRNLIEEMWCAEILEAALESCRLQRFKRQIPNSAKPAALRNLLGSITDNTDPEGIDELAFRWFSQKRAKKKVAAMLVEVGLDDSAVDAEAYRLSLAEIVQIDRRLTELAERRDEIVRLIEDYRAGVAAPVRFRQSKVLTQPAGSEPEDG